MFCLNYCKYQTAAFTETLMLLKGPQEMDVSRRWLFYHGARDNNFLYQTLIEIFPEKRLERLIAEFEQSVINCFLASKQYKYIVSKRSCFTVSNSF